MKIPRLHLFEFEDQKWFPSVLRDLMTDYLRFVGNKMGILNPSVDLIVETLKESSTNRMFDMCSGGGGAWLSLLPQIREEIEDVSMTISDLYPNKRAFDIMANKSSGEIEPFYEPVDAMNVNHSTNALRTQCLSFHHFDKKSATSLIQNAVDNNDPILILEGQERSISTVIQFMFVPLFVFALTPFIYPFSLARLVFTYIIPVLPFLILWDGVVSALRTYEPEEMIEMVNRVNGHDSYKWDAGKSKASGITNVYLKGIPMSEGGRK